MPTYVYAITGAEHPAHIGALTGVGDQEGSLRAVTAGPLKAIVGDAPEGLRAKRRHLLAHQQVLEALMADGPVLPMRFGLTAPDDEQVRAVVAEHAPKYLDRLRELDDVCEYNLKAARDEEDLLREIITTVPEARRLNDLTRADPGAHREKQQLGQIVAREVRTRQDLAADGLISRLEPRALRRSHTEPAGPNFLNVSFLVARNRAAEFSEAVHQEAEHLGDSYALSLNGPLPPYSFV